MNLAGVTMPPNRAALLTPMVTAAAFALSACGGGSPAPTATTPPPSPSPAPAPAPAPPPAGAVEMPLGYFALTTRRLSDTEKAALVGNPAISGMTSYVTWADIEPTRDQFDFSKIDADIAIARAAGKKITIGVFAGRDGLPGWLASAGVRLWTNGEGTELIHPGDTAFVALWQERVARLGQRYDNDPTVVQVTICGAAGTLCGPRYPELPADLTYDQLLANWRQVVDAYLAAFPNTFLNLEVHATAGYDTRLPTDLFAQIPNSAAIGPFAEFLSDAGPQPASPLGQAFAAIAGGRNFCAFQMVSPLGDKVDEAVALGRGYGCRYFEIYAADVTDHAAGLPAL